MNFHNTVENIKNVYASVLNIHINKKNITL